MFTVNLPLHYILTSLVFLGIFSVNFSTAASITSTVHIEEEKIADSFVVNVAELFKADKFQLSRRKFKFKMLSQKLRSTGSEPQQGQSTWVKLDSQTGVMTTSRKIDRDTECAGLAHCVVQLQVIMLPQTSFTWLDLELVIDDVNDNAPTFQHDVIDIKISEAWQVDEVYNLDPYQAKDTDSGNNSEIFYELLANSYFTLRQTKGRGGLQHLELVLSDKLDHERESVVNMVITAVDNGKPPQRSETNLKVTVLDANDNTPTFDQEEYKITLLENSSPGRIIDTIAARDGDSGAYGLIRYSISSRNTKLAGSLFTIDSRSGELRLREKVDREKHNGVRVLIEARDSDPDSRKMGESWLIINVEDVNDNAPEISIVYILHAIGNTVYIPESTQGETFIMRTSASDADSGDNGRVKINMETTTTCTENDDGKFATQETFLLHPDGLVATVRPLDRESCDKYIIMITACDHGNTPKCSSQAIKVRVLDENEFAPKFRASTQRVTIPEDTATGSRITTVRAYDGDSEGKNGVVINSRNEVVDSKNGLVEYFLTSGTRGPFSVNRKTGEISLQRKIDREDKGEWQITVTAQDGAIPRSLESSCTIVITVSDVNDNAPKFLNPRENHSLVYASTISDKPILKLMAQDKDTFRNAEVRFKLLSEEQESVNSTRRILLHNSQNSTSSFFALNPTTGELKLNFSRRNFSNILGMHTVAIQAYDLGSPSQKSNITINIQVSNSPLPYRNSDDLSVAGQSKVLLGACIGSAFLLIIIILAMLIAVKCRRTKKESKTYSLPKEEINGDVLEKDDVIDALSIEMEPVDVIVTESDCPDKSRVTVATRLIDDGVASTSRCDSVSRLPHEDMGYLSVARNVEITSPSHSDGDSGRGDSESDGVACRNHRKEASSRLGANCTEQCMELGHSDSCWMPLIKNLPPGAPLNRPLGRISEKSSAYRTQRARQPLRVVNASDMRECRSPSRASNLDENLAYMQRTPSNSNFVGYDVHYPAPSRCMSPNYGHFHNPQNFPPQNAGMGALPSNRLTTSCLLLPRASVASTSNLLGPNERYFGPSSSATNFLMNYHPGNTKINAENAQKSLNPHCRTTASPSHMLPINVQCPTAPGNEQFVPAAHFQNSPTESNLPQCTSGEIIIPCSSSMLV